jgi:hypothetical protein
MPGLPFMDQWRRDEIARAERLDAEYIARQEARRAAYRKWVADANGDHLARGHVRPQSSDAAVWIVFGVAGVGALFGWLAAHGLLRAVEWMAGAL